MSQTLPLYRLSESTIGRLRGRALAEPRIGRRGADARAAPAAFVGGADEDVGGVGPPRVDTLDVGHSAVELVPGLRAVGHSVDLCGHGEAAGFDLDPGPGVHDGGRAELGVEFVLLRMEVSLSLHGDRECWTVVVRV